MPGHLSAACQTSRQHKCENASTLCSGIKPRQRSAGRPPPGPQTSPWPRSWLRTGRPSAPVERGASALAQVVAQDRAPVCPGGPGGKATWPRSRPRTGRPSAPVDRGARRPGPGRGPGPGARLPRCTGRPRPRVILGPDRGRPAGRWRGLRQGAGQDADVGGRQDARPPARARPGGAGRVQARPGEGRRGPAMPGRLASASLSICWPGRGGRRSAGAGCAGRDANVRGQAGRASTSQSEAGRGRAGPA